MKTLSHEEPRNRLSLSRESELIRQVKDGKEEAFEELARRYRPTVYSHLVRLCSDTCEAEDVLQDVMITMYLKIDTFEGKSAFSTWLYRITVNAFLMYKRKQRRHQAHCVGDEPFEAFMNTLSLHKEAEHFFYYHILSNEMRAKLEHALSELPTRHRKVFLMHNKDDLPIGEISSLLGISIPAAKSLHHRARQFLKERLKQNTFN